MCESYERPSLTPRRAPNHSGRGPARAGGEGEDRATSAAGNDATAGPFTAPNEADFAAFGHYPDGVNSLRVLPTTFGR
jgi:hypothetical protein